MESRLRLVLVLHGLPVPEVQFPVPDDRRRRAVWLDLAYPGQRIGIEHEGEEHTRPERVLRDVGRYTRGVSVVRAVIELRWVLARRGRRGITTVRALPRRSSPRSARLATSVMLVASWDRRGVVARAGLGGVRLGGWGPVSASGV
jgi:hypothetical protein